MKLKTTLVNRLLLSSTGVLALAGLNSQQALAYGDPFNHVVLQTRDYQCRVSSVEGAELNFPLSFSLVENIHKDTGVRTSRSIQARIPAFQEPEQKELGLEEVRHRIATLIRTVARNSPARPGALAPRQVIDSILDADLRNMQILAQGASAEKSHLSLTTEFSESEIQDPSFSVEVMDFNYRTALSGPNFVQSFGTLQTHLNLSNPSQIGIQGVLRFGEIRDYGSDYFLYALSNQKLLEFTGTCSP